VAAGGRRDDRECNLAALADWLGFDAADYRSVLIEALELTRTPAYLILHEAVTGLLA
jgi:hypothetical protein